MPNDHEPSRNGRRPRVGSYQIVAPIAKGGMSVVYRTLDTVNHRETALKIMLPELTTKPNLLERFRREGRLGSNLQHEHIVRVYEAGEHFGVNFMALELLQGLDLDYYVEQTKQLSAAEA